MTRRDHFCLAIGCGWLLIFVYTFLTCVYIAHSLSYTYTINFEQKEEQWMETDSATIDWTVWTVRADFASWFQSMENDPHSRLTCLFMMCMCVLRCYFILFHFMLWRAQVSLCDCSSWCSHLVVFSVHNYNSPNHNSAWHYRISCFFYITYLFLFSH